MHEESLLNSVFSLKSHRKQKSWHHQPNIKFIEIAERQPIKILNPKMWWTSCIYYFWLTCDCKNQQKFARNISHKYYEDHHDDDVSIRKKVNLISSKYNITKQTLNTYISANYFYVVCAWQYYSNKAMDSEVHRIRLKFSRKVQKWLENSNIVVPFVQILLWLKRLKENYNRVCTLNFVTCLNFGDQHLLIHYLKLML